MKTPSVSDEKQSLATPGNRRWRNPKLRCQTGFNPGGEIDVSTPSPGSKSEKKGHKAAAGFLPAVSSWPGMFWLSRGFERNFVSRIGGFFSEAAGVCQRLFPTAKIHPAGLCHLSRLQTGQQVRIGLRPMLVELRGNFQPKRIRVEFLRDRKRHFRKPPYEKPSAFL